MSSNPQIDQYINKITDWKKPVMETLRQLITSTASELTENWKWNVPVWTFSAKPVVALSVFKDHVKLNFFRGSELTAYLNTFNNGLESKNHRSIDFAEGDKPDLESLKKLILAAQELEKVKK